MIPENLILEGARVRLEPLARTHAADLHASCNDPALWEFTFQSNPFGTLESTIASIDAASALANSRPFAVVDRATGRAIGSTRFLDVDPANRKLEIGWTYLSQAVWRTGVNTECKLLLLGYAFDIWKAVRVQFKAEAINTRSCNAIVRLGAKHEGTLRNFRIRPNGEYRDTSFFGIIASEWPTIKPTLERPYGGAVDLRQ